jgi:hypothetical protein
MMPSRDGKPWRRPKADYILEKEAQDGSDRMDADIKFP